MILKYKGIFINMQQRVMGFWTLSVCVFMLQKEREMCCSFSHILSFSLSVSLFDHIALFLTLWLIGFRSDPLIGCLSDSLIGCLSDFLICWLSVWLSKWLSVWLSDWLVVCLTLWLAGYLWPGSMGRGCSWSWVRRDSCRTWGWPARHQPPAGQTNRRS